MDTGPALRAAPRGATLLELVICLAVLALVMGAFGDHIQGSVTAETSMYEYAAADRVMGEVQALLTAEDAFAGPPERTYERPNGVTARARASMLCLKPTIPSDNASVPSLCPSGARPVRRWALEVEFPVTTRPGTTDTLRVTFDVAAPSAGQWSAPSVSDNRR